jgi:hypothetical protein
VHIEAAHIDRLGGEFALDDIADLPDFIEADV